TPAGQPDPTLALSGAEGVRVVAPGIVSATLHPRRTLGDLTLEARADGQVETRRVRFVTGPPDAIEASVRAGAPGSYLITARVTDAGAHELAIAPTASCDAGAVSSFEPIAGGAYRARYEIGPAGDPGEVVLRAGAVERRLRFDQATSGRPRLDTRGVFVSNLSHATGGGALVGASLPLGLRVSAGVETGLLFLSGSTETDLMTPVDHSLVAVPLRLQAELGLRRWGLWRLLAGAHGGAWLARVSVQGRDIMGKSFPEFSRSEAALDVGAALIVLRQLRGESASALEVALGYDYTPVVSGDTVTGNLGGIEIGLGWRSRP